MSSTAKNISAADSQSGVQGVNTGYSNGIVNLPPNPVSPEYLSQQQWYKATCDLPLPDDSNVKNLPYHKNLPLADPTFDRPGRVDLVNGCDAWQDNMKPETKQGNTHQPMAGNTTLISHRQEILFFGLATIRRYTPDNSTPPSSPVLVCKRLPVNVWKHCFSSFGRLRKYSTLQ